MISDIFWNKTHSNRSSLQSNNNLNDQKLKIIRDKADMSYEDETKRRVREFEIRIQEKKSINDEFTLLKSIDPMNIPLNFLNLL